MMDETPKPRPEAQKPRRNCLFYGCVMGSLLLLVMLVAGLFGYRMLKRMLTDFTSTTPQPLPQVTISQAELEALQQRVEKFRGEVLQGTAPGPLSLSATELNALLNSDPDVQAWKGKLYVQMEANRLKAQVSLPMEQLGSPVPPVFKGRYLNGTAILDLGISNGLLRLTAQSLFVKGKQLPEGYMDKIRKQNLAQEVNTNPRVKAALERVKEIKIQDGKLVIVPKGLG